MPRETVPRLTAEEAGRYLRAAAERLGLEFVESSGVVPIYLLLPPGTAPAVTLFQTWHAEPLPVEPAAVEGAERLALGAAVAGVEASGKAQRVALVVAPAAGAGSRGLDQALREHRDRLAPGAAYWIRVAPSVVPASSPPAASVAAEPTAAGAIGRRRRVFLGARGRVVIALRGGEGNPYRARDAVVEALREEAYGPRPLDFELIRKLAEKPDALELIGEANVAGAPSSNETRLQRALFSPRGDIVIPAVAHPDRPRAWLTFEIAEAAEADPIAKRVEALSGGGAVEIVEHFPWDRANIHHPAIHALIELSRSRAEGAEIWPSSPWPTPSGIFSRALGVGLAEWGVPLPAGAMIRFPKPAEFEAIAAEAADLLIRACSETA